MNYLKYFSFLFIFLFISCEKDEIPIDPHLSGAVILQQVELEQDYKNQVFYKLRNNSIVSKNIKTEWDLGFIIYNNDDYIILNSSTFMQVAHFPADSFENEIDINSLQWGWDNPRGIDFGTVISYDSDSSNIFIIDRGYSLDGNNRGYKKFMIKEVTDYYYIIRYSNLDNSEDTEIQINKGNSNLTTYSFDTDNNVLIFPEDNEWDLVFTQYTTLFSDTNTPAYLVTGVLTNYRNNITVSYDTINDFEQINLSMIGNYNFSNNQDQIGYNWKSYNFQNNLYVINDEWVYLIKDAEGRYFKMQFIDFYNDVGIKGYPKFKIQEL